MSDLKAQLIKLGNQKEALREHIRPVLAELNKAAGSVEAEPVNMAGGQAVRVRYQPNLTMYRGLVAMDVLNQEAKKLKKAALSFVRTYWPDRILNSEMYVYFDAKSNGFEMDIEIAHPAQEDADLVEKNLRV